MAIDVLSYSHSALAASKGGYATDSSSMTTRRLGSSLTAPRPPLLFAFLPGTGFGAANVPMRRTLSGPGISMPMPDLSVRDRPTCRGHEESNDPLEWQRDGAVVGSTSIPTFVDTKELNTHHRYKLCVANSVNRICSEEVTAGSFGLAASFESMNRRKHFLRHRSWLGVLTPVNNNQDSEDIAFFVRPGLTGDARTVSFESVNFRGTSSATRATGSNSTRSTTPSSSARTPRSGCGRGSGTCPT
jgi:hypothetical protein